MDFSSIFAFVLSMALMGGLLYLLYRRGMLKISVGMADGASDPAAPPDVYTHAANLNNFWSQQPPLADLRRHADYKAGVELLLKQQRNPEELSEYLEGNNAIAACMAADALLQLKHNHALAPLLNAMPQWDAAALRVLLDVVDKLAEKQAVAWRVLLAMAECDYDDKEVRLLRAFLLTRKSKGDSPTADDIKDGIDFSTRASMLMLLHRLEIEELEPLANSLTPPPQPAADLDELEEFALVRRPTDAVEDVNRHLIEHRALTQTAQKIEQGFSAEATRSAVVVGEPGVGKSSLVAIIERRLLSKGWTVVRASAAHIMSGQKYIGELEQRTLQLVESLCEAKNVLWIIDNIHELSLAGRHQFSSFSILDTILPYIERGDITVLGETASRAWERLVTSRPLVRSAFDVHRIEATNESQTLDIVKTWVRAYSRGRRDALLNDKTIAEAMELSNQFLNRDAAPGNILRFLDITRSAVEAATPGKQRAINAEDLISTLSQVTGLPRTILDDRAELNLSELRAFFNERVFGQEEAVDCLVDRVAMIKAGLTDPTRPLGVFLFVGPTGTGKTEIAKSLAQFLFGSAERMIRLDMSEFGTPESLGRLMGDSREISENVSLTHEIRRQPFSVVLLDEFEKAAPAVWDLFLQVFDDGRLTDRGGSTADFRHSIIIMTSNLGAAGARARIGFDQTAEDFEAGRVEDVVGQVFRREFVNRIDRVVVFHPLKREIMRDLLHKELHAVLKRRGLRSRTWAVEWDESAINFLLERGYTADLGARPLKRAIERYLLSPLAKTIVANQFPDGDQFLHVRAAKNNNQLEVEFIDPDQDAGSRQGELFPSFEDRAADDGTEPRTRDMVMDARGSVAEVAHLSLKVSELDSRITASEWEEAKERALADASSPEFWESEERFEVLARAEYMDRVEEAMRTARRLLEKLAEEVEEGSYPPRLVQRLAQQVYLLGLALDCLECGEEQDAFVQVEAVREGAKRVDANNEFAMRIAKMYWNWAKKRNMRIDVLEEVGGEGREPFRLLMAVSGFGALHILRLERGLHAFELNGEKRNAERSMVRVRVVPQPLVQSAPDYDALAAARDALEQEDDKAAKIIRRYQKEPTPLVRDVERKWRSGRLDRVLDGEFDVIGAGS